MAQHPQVPKFGNWESDEVPYTMYFDNARKGKKSGQIHQIDPQDHFDMDQQAPEVKMPKHEQRSGQEEGKLWRPTDSKNTTGHKPYNNAQFGSNKSVLEPSRGNHEVLRPKHDRRWSREEGEMERLTDSPLRHEAAGRVNSPHHRHGGLSAGETPRRVRSTDQSPLHPHSQARVGGRNSGISSPSWERKASSEGSHGLAPSTPGRSRLRSVTRGDDSPDRGPAVPKFGEWDETDPASAEGYTHIFERVREEKHSEAGKVPAMPTETSYPNGQKQYGNDTAKGCGCFPWGKR